MRKLIGTPIELTKPIMGVITTKPKIFSKNNHQALLIQSDEVFSHFRWWIFNRKFKAIIASESVKDLTFKESFPIIYIPHDRCSQLHEGDVVLIEADGKINLLYEIESSHNSLFVTNRCNCHCLMCPQPPADDPENIIEQNLILISLINKSKTTRLGITGGEPTLIGDDLIRIIEECRKRLPQTFLDLLTNGRKLADLDFAKSIAKVGYPALMIDIPIYSDNDTEHDRIMGAKGSFYETLEGLHNLALLRQPVGLRTVLHRLTIDRLEQYAEFVYRNLPFVVQVAFMGMETTGLAKDNLENLWIDPFDYQEELKRAVKYLIRRNVQVSIYNHQLCTLPHDLWPFARRSISTWKESYLPECNSCKVKSRCGGFFATGERYSKHINPITNDENSL